MATNQNNYQPTPTTKTPEPRPENLNPANNQVNTPSTPGMFAPFDWDEFETRYEQALRDANDHERELLNEFDRLLKVRALRFVASFCQHFLLWPF
jgi:hypothetical protein